MAKQDLIFPELEGPFLLPGASEAEGDREQAVPTSLASFPGELQEAGPSAWNLTPEVLENSGPLAESSPIEPYAGIPSPGSHELSESEIGALFDDHRSTMLLHWLLGSSDLQRATLSALLARPDTARSAFVGPTFRCPNT